MVQKPSAPRCLGPTSSRTGSSPSLHRLEHARPVQDVRPSNVSWASTGRRDHQVAVGVRARRRRAVVQHGAVAYVDDAGVRGRRTRARPPRRPARPGSPHRCGRRPRPRPAHRSPGRRTPRTRPRGGHVVPGLHVPHRDRGGAVAQRRPRRRAGRRSRPWRSGGSHGPPRPAPPPARRPHLSRRAASGGRRRRTRCRTAWPSRRCRGSPGRRRRRRGPRGGPPTPGSA